VTADCLLYTRHSTEGVAEITFNRPNCLNTLNLDMAAAFAEAATAAANAALESVTPIDVT